MHNTTLRYGSWSPYLTDKNANIVKHSVGKRFKRQGLRMCLPLEKSQLGPCGKETDNSKMLI